MNLAQHIAGTGDAMHRCYGSKNMELFHKHGAELKRVASELLPHGSGFDRTALIDHAGADKIVIIAPFHKMDENGYYSGWVNFKVTVKASLIHGFVLRVTGGDEHDREYVADVYREILGQEYK